jgi:hypothetical protein
MHFLSFSFFLYLFYLSIVPLSSSLFPSHTPVYISLSFVLLSLFLPLIFSLYYFLLLSLCLNPFHSLFLLSISFFIPFLCFLLCFRPVFLPFSLSPFRLLLSSFLVLIFLSSISLIRFFLYFLLSP